MAAKKPVKRVKKSRSAKASGRKSPAQKNFIGTIIIAAVILVAAVALAFTISQMRAKFLKQQTLTIKNEATGQEKTIQIQPASAGNIQPITNTAQAPASSVPVKNAAPGKTNPIQAIAQTPAATPVTDFRVYFKPVGAKEHIPHIDTPEAKFLYESGKAVFVDARGASEYDDGHVKGSVSIPVSASNEDIAKLKDKLEGKVLVTYCHGAGCHLSDKTAFKLYDLGYRKIAIFFGGWPKWTENKLPITTKTK
jgi:rhodanese-related sulfurtransferase